MRTFIDLTQQQHSAVWQHVLPPKVRTESAAFLFAEVERRVDEIVLKTCDVHLVSADEFEIQESDYIELADEARISIIQKAHNMGAALVEIHSHPFPGPWAAAFSRADMNGFEETVPHMWWRLPDRPYAAIVVAFDGFDALIWHDSPHKPQDITNLRVDGKLLNPSNRTIGCHQWK